MKQMTIFDFLDANDPEPNYSANTLILMEIFKGMDHRYIDRAALREIIQAKTGRYVPDRTMRKMIEAARNEGFVICNGQDGAGYFVPITKEELKRQYDQNESRALAIMRQQKYIRRELAKWT